MAKATPSKVLGAKDLGYSEYSNTNLILSHFTGTIDGTNGKIFYKDTSAEKDYYLKPSELLGSYQTKILEAATERDLFGNSYQAEPVLSKLEYNTGANEVIPVRRFDNSPVANEMLHANFGLPVEYNGGDLYIMFVFITSGTNPEIPYDHVHFKIAGHFKQSGAALNGALCSYKDSGLQVTMPGYKYHSNVISLSPSGAATGQGTLHLSLYRDYSLGDNYPDYVYLSEVYVKYPVNKWLS